MKLKVLFCLWALPQKLTLSGYSIFDTVKTRSQAGCVWVNGLLNLFYENVCLYLSNVYLYSLTHASLSLSDKCSLK